MKHAEATLAELVGEARMTPSLIVATPVRGGELWSTSVSTGYSENLRALEKELPVGTISATVTYHVDAGRARNRLVGLIPRDFPTATAVLFWDDDQWPEDRRIVPEMMRVCHETQAIIAAPYTNKVAPLRWVHWNYKPAPPEVNGLQEVRAVGFGFTMVPMSCLLKMSAKHRRYTDHPKPHKVANLFGALYDSVPGGATEEDDALLSEDYSFCKRWRGDKWTEPGKPLEPGCGQVFLYMNAGIIFHAGHHAFSAREMPGGVVG